MPLKRNKQKKVEAELVGYDLDMMTNPELKQYAYMLEKDIETMRNYCSFYQKAEDKLGDFCRARREELKEKEHLILAKDVEMERLRLKVEQKICEKRQWPIYNDFAEEERKARNATELSERLEKQMDEHIDEQMRLKAEIEEKERELDSEGKKIQMARRDALEKNTKKLKDIDEYEKILLEKSIKAFVGMMVDFSQLNRLALQSIEAEALEDRRRGEQEFRDNCASYKEKLHKYYKDITREDLDAIRELTLKAKRLEASIKSTHSQIRCVQQQNQQLKAISSRPKAPAKYIPPNPDVHRRIKLTKETSNLKRIEQLKTENEVLINKIKTLNEQTDNLRRQFTQALYKVRQSAEMKVSFLRKKLEQAQNESVNDEEQISPSITKSNDSQEQLDVSEESEYIR